MFSPAKRPAAIQSLQGIKLDLGFFRCLLGDFVASTCGVTSSFNALPLSSDVADFLAIKVMVALGVVVGNSAAYS